MTDTLTIILLGANALLIATAIIFFSLRHFELAIFLIVLSPWISAAFVPNTGILAEGQGPNLGSYARIGLLIVLGFVGIVKTWTLRSENPGPFPKQFWLFSSFLILALFSTAYSIDKQYTFIRSVGFVAFFFFLLGLNAWLTNVERLERVLNVIFFALAFCLIVNVVALAAFPGSVWNALSTNRFQGLWGHPNAMGSFCMILYPIFLWKLSRSNAQTKWLITLLILCTAFLHILTGSRTTLLASAVGVCLALFILGKRLAVFFLGVTLIASALMLLHLQPSNLNRQSSQGLTGLTGRTEIWKAALTLSKEKPILGYGYAVAGKIFEDPRFNDSELGLWTGSARVSLHNGYLSAIIGLGYVGFFLFYLSLFIPFVRSLNVHLSGEQKAVGLSILLMCLLTNLTESAIVGPSSLGALILWIMWTAFGRLHRLNITVPQNSVSSALGPGWDTIKKAAEFIGTSSAIK
jgi:O-antigen ligase